MRASKVGGGLEALRQRWEPFCKDSNMMREADWMFELEVRVTLVERRYCNGPFSKKVDLIFCSTALLEKYQVCVV